MIKFLFVLVQVGGMYFDDAGVLPVVDTVQYGLEKIDSDVIDFYRSTTKPVLKYQNKDRKVIPPLWPRTTHEIIVNPTMHKVMPPIWPTTSVIIDTVISSIKFEKQNNTKVETTPEPVSSDVVYNTESTTPSVKPMKRRSVSNYVLDEDYDSVILRILDHNGQSKIEIKIRSDNFSQNKFGKFNGTKRIKNITNYTLKSGRNVYHETAESAKNTVITICTNDSVLIEEPKSTNVTEFLKTISSITTRDENVSNITKGLKTSPISGTVNEESPSFLENESKPMDYKINSSNLEIEMRSSNIGITKHEISSNTVTNGSSEFDVIFDSKTNNTEFHKRIFKEEPYIVNDTTRVNAPNNDKISISDIYPHNYTDLFIEGDSDMVY